MEIVDFLKRVNLFSGLPAQVLEQIARITVTNSVAAGHVLFYEGEPGDALYIVGTGGIEVYLTDRDTGVDIPLRRFKPTEYLGEMALIAEEPRSASARAVEDSALLVLTRDAFLRIVAHVPAVGLALAQELSRRLREANKRQGVSFVDLTRYRFDTAAYATVPRRILEMHRAIPLRRTDDVLTVAMVDPADLVALDDLRRGSGGLIVEPLAVTLDDYEAFLQKNVGRLPAATPQRSEKRIPQPMKYVGFSDEGAPEVRRRDVSGIDIVHMLDAILGEAIDHGASDVHIEPRADRLEIRYRVDGRLRRRTPPSSPELAAPVVSRVKVLAKMDISETRHPQDGRFTAYRGRQKVDFRVSTLPSMFGEKAVLRVLDPAMLTTGLDTIIMATRVCEMAREMVRQPYGLVIATGPTSSGKTTTLYSLLNEIDRDTRNVVTVEDPIEYDVGNTTQTQVNYAIKLGFSEMVRSILRQNPDVVLIGETRDPATAEATIEAALTGHLVLSSMHTNDAVGTVARLIDMGIEPFLIASSLIGVLNQRLVRRVCAGCREPVELEPRRAEMLREAIGPDYRVDQVFEGRGCDACFGSGYRGQVAAFEVLRITDTLKQLIASKATLTELRDAAIAGGLVPMRAYAGFLVARGLTSAVEAIRILSKE